MSSTVVVIDGKEVLVPNNEIPRITDELTKAYARQLVTSEAEVSPQDEFIAYRICENALATRAGYTDRTLRVRAGNLWGAMCRVTKHGKLHYDTLCDSCGGTVSDVGGAKRQKCHHPHPSMGYRLILIRRSSILANFIQLRGLEFQKSQSVKQDYLYLLAEINNSPV